MTELTRLVSPEVIPRARITDVLPARLSGGFHRYFPRKRKTKSSLYANRNTSLAIVTNSITLTKALVVKKAALSRERSSALTMLC